MKILESMKTGLPSGTPSSCKEIPFEGLPQFSLGDSEAPPALIHEALAGSSRAAGQIRFQCRPQELTEGFAFLGCTNLGALEELLVHDGSDLPPHGHIRRFKLRRSVGYWQG